MLLLGRRRALALVRPGTRNVNNKQKIKPKDRSVAKQQDVPRDAMGRPILPPREKSLGTFKPLPATSLTHELFETEGFGRVGLDLPQMQNNRNLSPGVVTRFQDTDPTSPLRVFGLPKHMLLEFRILGMAASVTTATTLSIIRALEESKEDPARLVLNGRQGCGKSFVLLQAAEYAAASGEWIVLYIPRARRFVDGSTPYSYSLATQTYLQPRAARETLQRFGTVNQHLLGYMTTTQPIEFEGHSLPEGTSLLDVIAASKEDETSGPAVLEAILREVAEQTLFPVLIAIDDFQTLASRSMYRDPRSRMIRPHHLSMPRLLLEYASGRKKLSRGMVLGALSRSDTQFPISAQLADALRLPADFAPSPRSVRERRSAQLAMYLENPAPEPEMELMPEDFGEEGYEGAEAYEAAEHNGMEGSEAAEYDGAEGNEVAEHDGSEEYESMEKYEPVDEAVEAEEADMENGEDLDGEAAAADEALRETDEEADEALREAEETDEGETDFEDEGGKEKDPNDDATLVQPWTGWRVYDPPMYEDSVVPTPSRPFPAPRPAEVWREMVQRDTDDAAAEVPEEDVEDAEEDEVDTVQDKKNKKKKKKPAKAQEAEGGVLALRAVRVQDALSVREASALFEMWLDAGVLRTGGERRAARRAELETLAEYRAVQLEVDGVPKEEREDDDEEQGEGDYEEMLAAYEKQLESESESDSEVEEMDEGEASTFDEMLVLEQMMGAQKLQAEHAAKERPFYSFDEQQKRELKKLLGEEGEESDWEESVADFGEEDLMEVAEEADSGVPVDDTLVEDEAVSEDKVALSDGEAMYDTDADAEHESELDLGEDEQIARTLSGGLRAALEDPSIAEDLVRAQDMPATAVAVESGADELFLAKYAESSGNARAFVWGGLLGTLQTSA